MNPPTLNQAGSERRPHIVFLFSDTGGGHRSAANAIIEAIEAQFPGQTTHEMVDIFRQYAPPPLHRAPEIYPPLSRMPRVFGAGFHISDGHLRTSLMYRVLWPYIRGGVKRLICEHPADVLVSVHQLINVPLGRALVNFGRSTPFVTVVTDLVTTHAAWYSDRANLIVVPSEAALERGINYHIPPPRMRIVGLPVADKFCQPAGDSEAFRARMGWPLDRPVVLLVGGGDGMGPLEMTAKAIDAANLRASLVIIAGRNQKLKSSLEQHHWRMPVKIYGFVQDMPDFMRASDILVTKAGPGTICEAFIAGLPVILYSRINGQEEGNVDYVVDHGAGVWAPRPDRVVAALDRWLKYPAEREQASRACRSLARPNASREIAALLMEQIRVPIH